MAWRPYYYGKGGKEKIFLDNQNLSVEKEIAPSFRKSINSPETCSQNDWFALSYLFANLFVRNPANIQELRAVELEATAKLNAIARKMIERLTEASIAGSDLSEFRSVIDDESPTFTLDQFNEHAAKLQAEDGHLFAANDIFAASSDIAKCIQEMTFWILEAPSDLFFVTSDRPLMLQRRINGSRVGAGWENDDALGSIALCPTRFLLMFYTKPKHLDVCQTKATPEQLIGLNLETMRFADQEVYSLLKYREADDWMKATGRWQPR